MDMRVVALGGLGGVGGGSDGKNTALFSSNFTVRETLHGELFNTKLNGIFTIEHAVHSYSLNSGMALLFIQLQY
jgi:hypothetical protein